MRQSIVIFVSLLVWMAASPLWAAEVLKPIPALQRDRLILVEGQSYCSAALGSGHIGLMVEGKSISATSNGMIPSIRGTKSTALNLDCYFQGWFVGYGFMEDTLTFDQVINLGGEDRNHGQIHFESLYAGKQFKLILHRLYVDLGLGVYQLESLFSRYNVTAQLDFAGTASTEKGFVGFLRPTWMFHPSLYASWTIQKGLDSKQSLVQTNVFALHFWKRF